MPDNSNSSEVRGEAESHGRAFGGPKLVSAPRASADQIAVAVETPLLRVWHLRVPHPWATVNTAEFFADVIHLFRRDDRIEVVCDTQKPRSTHAVIIVDAPSPEGGLHARELAIYREAA